MNPHFTPGYHTLFSPPKKFEGGKWTHAGPNPRNLFVLQFAFLQGGNQFIGLYEHLPTVNLRRHEACPSPFLRDFD